MQHFYKCWRKVREGDLWLSSARPLSLSLSLLFPSFADSTFRGLSDTVQEVCAGLGRFNEKEDKVQRWRQSMWKKDHYHWQGEEIQYTVGVA